MEIPSQLLEEAKMQWILRISATDADGNYSLDKTSALRIMEHYRERILRAQFPASNFWMLK